MKFIKQKRVNEKTTKIINKKSVFPINYFLFFYVFFEDAFFIITMKTTTKHKLGKMRCKIRFNLFLFRPCDGITSDDSLAVDLK